MHRRVGFNNPGPELVQANGILAVYYIVSVFVLTNEIENGLREPQ